MNNITINNMEYVCDWCEEKLSSTGKTYTVATLQGVGDVSIWPDYAHYAEVRPGATLKGVIQTKGKYKNLVSELAKPQFMRQGIAQAQEKKAEYIKEAQSRKQDSIALFNATNNAVSILNTLYGSTLKELAVEEIRQQIIEWRDWLLNEYEHYEKQSHVTPF